MADNSKNSDPKSTPITSADDADFWEMDQDNAPTDLDDIDLEEIHNELNKDLNIKPVEKPITNLTDSELQIADIDESDVINTLETAKLEAETDSEHDLTDEELEHFRAPAAPAAPAAPVAAVDTTKQTSFIEKIMMTLCFIAIIGLGGYFISYLYDKFDVQSEPEWASNIPASGEYASIKEVKTWWTVPQSNNTPFDVKLVPAATITLDSDSKTGTLRAVFYSYEEGVSGNKRAKGDPFALAFADGKFLSTGSDSVTIYGTDGYTDITSFEYYRTQNEDRWTVSIREAASGVTDANDFEDLGIAPIEPIRISTEKTDAPKTASE